MSSVRWSIIRSVICCCLTVVEAVVVKRSLPKDRKYSIQEYLLLFMFGMSTALTGTHLYITYKDMQV